MHCQVSTLSTLLFKGGQVIDQRVGALNKKALEDFINPAL